MPSSTRIPITTSSRGAFWLSLLCLATMAWLHLPRKAVADEPAVEFLEALQQAGYFDVALDYLESARTDPNVSDAFKTSIDYQKAETLIASTRNVRDAETVNKRLDEAQALLQRYASSNPSIKTQAKTYQYSGVLYSSRADILFRQSESSRLTVSERNKLLVEARGMLQQAKVNIEKAKQLVERLIDPKSDDAIRIDRDDPSTIKELSRMRDTYTRVTKFLPEVIERLADTYPASDPNRKKYLDEAITKYMVVWEKYRERYAAGIQAAVYAGRCHQKLGQHKKALERFSEVFALGSGGTLKRIKKDAYVLATDSWNQQQPYPHRTVALILEPVVRGLTRTELREADWLRVQLELGIAKHARAAEIKQAGGPKANAEAKTTDRAAAKVIRNVARVPSPYRDQAKQLLSEWNIPLVDATEETALPETFEDALQLGRDRIAEIESIATEAAEARRRLSNAKDESTRNDLQGQVEQIQTQLTTQSDSAHRALQLAMELAGDETTVSDRNTVRYLQSFVYFAAGQYPECVVLGDYLLRFYPNESAAKQVSSYVIQSYAKMVDEAGAKSAFERAELERVCDLVLKLFPGSNEAGLAATTMMVKVILPSKDHTRGQEYLGKIPNDYQTRPRIALRLGQLKWMDYKQQLRAKVDPASLEPLLGSAIESMSEGVSSLTPDDVSYDSAVGALMLVDAQLASGKVAEAVSNLESSNKNPAAPLELIKMQHPSISVGDNAALYRQEAYKVAIKAYLASMRQPGADQQAWVDKASGILEHMKQMADASKDAASQARLTAVYQLIAAELVNGFESIKDQSEKQKFAKTLDRFLTQTQQGAKDGKVIFWAGSTMYEVANSLITQGNREAAVPMMARAVETLDRAEQVGLGDASSPELKLKLRRTRALALRGAGRYQKAVEEFIEVLSAGKTPVSYQIDAAQTLQEWGVRSRNAEALMKATGGAGETVNAQTGKKSKAIWGWIRLRQATMRDKKYRNIYYTALYGIVEGRYEFGKINKSKKAISSAMREIKKEQEKDSTFSGMENWKRKFARLASRIGNDL